MYISGTNQWITLPNGTKAPATPHTSETQPYGVNLNTLNNGNTVYRVEDAGGFLVEGNWIEVRDGVHRNASCIAHDELGLVQKYDFSDIVDMFEDPTATKTQAAQDYQEFLKEGQSVVNRLKTMDSTNSLDIKFRINGASVQFKENVTMANRDTALSDQRQIQNWINENRDELGEIGKKGAKYAISQAYIDYSKEVDLTRNESLCTNDHWRFMGMIERYAVNGFGTNPISYNEIKAICGTGYSYDPNHQSTDANIHFSA